MSHEYMSFVLRLDETIDSLLRDLPHSREKELAQVKLEEARLWLTKRLINTELAQSLGIDRPDH
jgi:hypothetical protein